MVGDHEDIIDSSGAEELDDVAQLHETDVNVEIALNEDVDTEVLEAQEEVRVSFGVKEEEEVTDEFSEPKTYAAEGNGQPIEVKLHDVKLERLGSCLTPSSYEICMQFKIGDPNILESITQKIYRKITCGGEFNPETDNQQVVYMRFVEEIVHRLDEAGVCYEIFKDDDFIYILLGMPDKDFVDWAIKEKFQLRLNPGKSRAYGGKINFPLANEELSEELWNDIWVGVHWHGIERDLYEKFRTNSDPNSETSIFSTKDRLALLYRVLCSSTSNGGCHFKIDRWCGDPDHPLEQIFPLSNEHEKKILNDSWTLCECMVKHQEGHQHDVLATRIRNFYGESLGFYFAFLLHFICGLVTLFPIGALLTTLYFYNDQSLDCKGVVPIIIVYCAWPMLFSAFWKRTEGELRSIWGCKENAKVSALKRPDFHGKDAINSITGRLDEVYDRVSRMIRLCISSAINFIYLLIVFLIISGLMGFRSWWGNEHPDDNLMPIVIGLITSIQVIIFDYIYKIIIFYLTQFENHRTQHEYENAYVRKTFVMKFLNGFMSLYYLGFVQPYFFPNAFKDKDGNTLEGTELNDRVLDDLAMQTAMLFVSLLFVNNATELLLPKFFKWCSGEFTEHSSIRREAKKEPCRDTMDEMSEIVMVYGYVSLFLVANPLLPLLGIIFALVEFVVDRNKYQVLSQRMIPQTCTGIGTWNDCLRFIAYFGIITNIALLTWRTNQVKNEVGEGYEDSFFIIMTLSVTALMLVFEQTISDVSIETKKRILRQDEIERRLIFDEKITLFTTKDHMDHDLDLEKIPDIQTFEETSI